MGVAVLKNKDMEEKNFHRRQERPLTHMVLGGVYKTSVLLFSSLYGFSDTFRLVRVSSKGYNLLEERSGHCVLRSHIYPKSAKFVEGFGEVLSFSLPKGCKIVNGLSSDVLDVGVCVGLLGKEGNGL